jgi:hypothetical protein
MVPDPTILGAWAPADRASASAARHFVTGTVGPVSASSAKEVG